MMDWRDGVELACDDFAPVRDHRETSQHAVVFTRFKDAHGTEVRVSLSSAAMRESHIVPGLVIRWNARNVKWSL